MTKEEKTARNLSLEARTTLINMSAGRAACLPQGTPALISAELLEAGCLAPPTMLLTLRGEIVREFVLDMKLDAMDASASPSRPESREVLGGPVFAEDVADPRDELVQAAKMWGAHLTSGERDLLVAQGEQTPTGRLYRAIQALR